MPITHLGSPNPTSARSSLSDAPTPPQDNCSQSPLRGSLGLATPRPSGTPAPCKHPDQQARAPQDRHSLPRRSTTLAPCTPTVRTSGLKSWRRCCERHGPAQPPPCREPCLPPRRDPASVQVPGTRNMGGSSTRVPAVQELREEGTGAPCRVQNSGADRRSSLPSAVAVGSDKDTPTAAALAASSQSMTMGRWSQHSPCPGVSGGCAATHDTSVGLTVRPVSRGAREALPPSRRRPMCPWHRGHTLLMTGARTALPHQHLPAAHPTLPAQRLHHQHRAQHATERGLLNTARPRVPEVTKSNETGFPLLTAPSCLTEERVSVGARPAAQRPTSRISEPRSVPAPALDPSPLLAWTLGGAATAPATGFRHARGTWTELPAPSSGRPEPLQAEDLSASLPLK